MADQRLERILEKVKPKTFFEDLAEYGYLMQYLREFMWEKFENDDEFRTRMFKIMYEHSKYPVQELNYYYLFHFNNVLEQFFKKVDHNA
jgi:hypothetical protein